MGGEQPQDREFSLGEGRGNLALPAGCGPERSLGLELIEIRQLPATAETLRVEPEPPP